MMKKKRYLTVITAALLAVSPVVASSVFTGQPTVKAATQLTSDQLMAPYYRDYESNDDAYPLLKVTKATPYFTVYAGETVGQLEAKRITDLKVNYGDIVGADVTEVYKTFDDGRPDFGDNSFMYEEDKFEAGKNYVAVVEAAVTNVPDMPNEDDSYAGFTDEDFGVSDNPTVDTSHPAVLIPIHVTAAPASTSTKKSSNATTSSNASKTTTSKTTKKISKKSSTKKAYVKVRKNHKVRTYTSRGKFSKYYVYGHHTYKVTSKKRIKGHGYCWKLSGKNQYVPAKYVKVR